MIVWESSNVRTMLIEPHNIAQWYLTPRFVYPLIISPLNLACPNISLVIKWLSDTLLEHCVACRKCLSADELEEIVMKADIGQSWEAVKRTRCPRCGTRVRPKVSASSLGYQDYVGQLGRQKTRSRLRLISTLIVFHVCEICGSHGGPSQISLIGLLVAFLFGKDGSTRCYCSRCAVTARLIK